VHAEPSHWLHEISICKTIHHHFLPGIEGGHHSDKNQTTRKGWEPYPSPSDKAPLIFNGWVWASTVEDFFRFRRSWLSSCAWQWLSNHATKIKAGIYDFLEFFFGVFGGHLTLCNIIFAKGGHKKKLNCKQDGGIMFFEMLALVFFSLWYQAIIMGFIFFEIKQVFIGKGKKIEGHLHVQLEESPWNIVFVNGCQITKKLKKRQCFTGLEGKSPIGFFLFKIF